MDVLRLSVISAESSADCSSSFNNEKLQLFSNEPFLEVVSKGGNRPLDPSPEVRKVVMEIRPVAGLPYVAIRPEVPGAIDAPQAEPHLRSPVVVDCDVLSGYDGVNELDKIKCVFF